jgi:predicted  nucleic acid-binding Zn-ribbon protein
MHSVKVLVDNLTPVIESLVKMEFESESAFQDAVWREFAAKMAIDDNNHMRKFYHFFCQFFSAAYLESYHADPSKLKEAASLLNIELEWKSIYIDIMDIELLTLQNNLACTRRQLEICRSQNTAFGPKNAGTMSNLAETIAAIQKSLQNLKKECQSYHQILLEVTESRDKLRLKLILVAISALVTVDLFFMAPLAWSMIPIALSIPLLLVGIWYASKFAYRCLQIYLVTNELDKLSSEISSQEYELCKQQELQQQEKSSAPPMTLQSQPDRKIKDYEEEIKRCESEIQAMPGKKQDREQSLAQFERDFNVLKEKTLNPYHTFAVIRNGEGQRVQAQSNPQLV